MAPERSSKSRAVNVFGSFDDISACWVGCYRELIVIRITQQLLGLEMLLLFAQKEESGRDDSRRSTLYTVQEDRAHVNQALSRAARI